MSDVALAGNLQSFRLADVLTLLGTTKKTGTLTVRNDGRESWVFLRGGSVIFAGSNEHSLRLSAILLRKRRINRAQFEQIDTLMTREGGRFGQIAIQQGVLTETQLHDFLKVQVSEILYDCFVWPSGTFQYTDTLELPPYAVTISVDLGNLIMEGARRIEEWEQCVSLLPDPTVVFRVVAHPDKDEKITLTLDEWQLLFLVNGQRTLEELCHDAESDPFQVYRIVYGLVSNKLIEPVEPAPKGEEENTAPHDTYEPAEATVVSPSTASEASTMIEAPRDDRNLLVSPDARLTYEDVIRPVIGQLVVEGGEQDGTIFALTEAEYSVGRSRENAIQLYDLGVSGSHARIFRGPDGYVVEDLRSRNGVWRNGARVFHAPLTHGDRLRFGTTELVYTVLFDAAETNRV